MQDWWVQGSARGVLPTVGYTAMNGGLHWDDWRAALRCVKAPSPIAPAAPLRAWAKQGDRPADRPILCRTGPVGRGCPVGPRLLVAPGQPKYPSNRAHRGCVMARWLLTCISC